MNIQVGDLVSHNWSNLGLGIITGWYDKHNGYALVLFHPDKESPYHVNKLSLIQNI